MQTLNNNNDASWLNHTLFKYAIIVLIAAGSAWAAYVNSKLGEVNDLRVGQARIEQKLDDFIKEWQHAQRHNP